MRDVVGYEYDGVAHCAGCTAADLRNGYIAEDTTYPGEFPPDEHGLPVLLIGPDGNLVKPMHARGGAVDTRVCDRCGSSLAGSLTRSEGQAA
ncbi:MAG TPA: hypothetical protein VFQ88_07210 [Nevskiaceae bacterium]|nr:hypothetical protein [Nevskiaceae bacterium]